MIVKREGFQAGRLSSRPRQEKSAEEFSTGLHQLGFDAIKDGLLYIPKGYEHSKPAAFAVMLHGSGGTAEQGMSLLRLYADKNNLILLAPSSRKYSWDIIASDNFGPDVIFINQAMEVVFNTFSIDTDKIAIGGFSDGASYAFCLGLTNGDLFNHIIAFSPGFSFTLEKHGTPKVFMSHGEHDRILPIEPCARRILPDLKKQGLEIEYLEFEGEHEIPLPISEKALQWFLQKPQP